MSKSKLVFTLFFSFLIPFFANLISPLFSFAQTEETLTITTYYPAPYGVYNDLRAKKIAAGTTYYDPSARPWDTGGGSWVVGSTCTGNEICDADLAVEKSLSIGKYLLEEKPIGGGLGFRLRIRPLYGDANLILDPRYNTELSSISFSRGEYPDTYQIRVSHNHPTAWAGGNAFGITDGTGNNAYLMIRGNSGPNQSGAGNVGIGTMAPVARLEINPTITPEGVDLTMFKIGMVHNNADSPNNAIANWYGAYIAAPTGIGIINNKYAFVTEANAGKVGIGTTSPSTILAVVQASATDPIADAWTIYSSRRWKTNIQPLTGALDKVESLNGVYFDWKADGKHDLGMIAEDVGKVIPEVVAYEENGTDAKSLDYARLTAVLVEAVKEQQKQIEQLKARLVALERR